MNQTVFRVGFVALAVIIMAVIAPVIWAAASAGVGLLALGVIGIVGFAGLQALPYIGQKIENTVLKLRRHEASVNPIEQLHNFLAQKAKQVTDFRQAVVSIATQIASLEDMVAKRKRERPSYDATAQEKSIAAMKNAHAALNTKYKNAENALNELRIAIQDKEFEWKFSQAGQNAMKSLSATSGQEVMEQMLADTAFSSVTDNFNKVFAELEMEAQTLTDAKQMSFDSGMTIDLSNINLSTKVM